MSADLKRRHNLSAPTEVIAKIKKTDFSNPSSAKDLSDYFFELTADCHVPLGHYKGLCYELYPQCYFDILLDEIDQLKYEKEENGGTQTSRVPLAYFVIKQCTVDDARGRHAVEVSNIICSPHDSAAERSINYRCRERPYGFLRSNAKHQKDLATLMIPVVSLALGYWTHAQKLKRGATRRCRVELEERRPNQGG